MIVAQSHIPQRQVLDERELFELFGLGELPELHPADLDEVLFHLHAVAQVLGLSAE
jgi:hypothetical protein